MYPNDGLRHQKLQARVLQALLILDGKRVFFLDIHLRLGLRREKLGCFAICDGFEF